VNTQPRFEKKGLWDIAIEKYTSRKLLVFLAASFVILLISGSEWLTIDVISWMDIRLTEDIKWLLENIFKPIAIVFLGTQGATDMFKGYTSRRSYLNAVPKTKLSEATETMPKDSVVPSGEELLSP